MAWPWQTRKILEERGYDLGRKDRLEQSKLYFFELTMRERGDYVETMASMTGRSAEFIMTEMFEHPADYDFRLRMLAKSANRGK